MSVRVAVCQTLTGRTISESLEKVHNAIRSAAAKGAQLVVLGEMFACKYTHKSFAALAEPIGPVGSVPDTVGESVSASLSSYSRSFGIHIVGGSVPEKVTRNGVELLYNTSVLFDQDGRIIQKYRKLHLFDVSIPGDPEAGNPRIHFMESETLTPGDLGLCLWQSPWGFDVGLGICYDIRFPELAIALREKSRDRMKLLIFPGQFNMVTGPRHWQLLGKARAVDTQSFCILGSVARSNDPTDYQCWGHSAIISPQGEILAELGPEEGVAIADIDMREVDSMRASIPTYSQKHNLNGQGTFDAECTTLGSTIQTGMELDISCGQITYMLPVMRGIDSRRQCILDCLERSYHDEGSPKQHSGHGMALARRKFDNEEATLSHIFNVFKEVEPEFASELAGATVETFPIKRLYNICQTYSSVWDPNRFKSSRNVSGTGEQSEIVKQRGPFPYVDDRATVLSELTKANILQTRHRVNSNSHPRWALRTIRRRRRKLLVKSKKRSISQEATRELQARLLADKDQKTRTDSKS